MVWLQLTKEDLKLVREILATLLEDIKAGYDIPAIFRKDRDRIKNILEKLET